MKNGDWIRLFFVVLLLFGTAQRAAASVREPVVAGRFYPQDRGRLQRAISFYLKDAKPAMGPRPIALVAPHAGFIYSGQICADAYQQAAGHDYEVIVLLGTNHSRPGYRGVSIYPDGGYRTPLGVMPVDETLSAKLAARSPLYGFEPGMHEREHSIEVHIPFVQTLFPRAKIMAAIVGTADVGFCAQFGRTLAELLAGRRVLVVASTDLSHYPNHPDAVAVDHRTLAAVKEWDLDTVHQALNAADRRPNLSTRACGEAAVLTAIAASRALGVRCARLISYANSGDTAIGSRDRVVGYGAVAAFRAEPAAPPASPPTAVHPDDGAFTAEQKQCLLAFARQTIVQYLSSRTLPLARPADADLTALRGAFVTLKKNGLLRGCIGHMAEDLPLCQAVGAMALQAAFNDRRFPRPVTTAEMDGIEIEISVLTPRRPVAGSDEIVLGRDGVVVQKAGRSAVYLPQVAAEQGWDKPEMLSHLCRKAGLPGDAWQHGARFETFQAVVFKESHFP